MKSQSIVLAATALLATAHSSHALVAAPVAPQHQLLRRQALPPSPTALAYLDEEGPALKHIWRQARTIKRHDRQQYFDFIAQGAGAGAAAPDGSAPSPPKDCPLDRLGLGTGPATTDEAPGASPRRLAGGRVAMLSLPSSVASLWLQAQTVAEDDRRLYFDFVKAQNQ